MLYNQLTYFSPRLLEPVTTALILPAPLTPVNALLAHQVANAFKCTALRKLPRNALVHTVLDRVDVLIACDFGFVEIV